MGHKWRHAVSVMDALACAPDYFSAEETIRDVLPVLFRHLAFGVAPARAAAARAVGSMSDNSHFW